LLAVRHQAKPTLRERAFVILTMLSETTSARTTMNTLWALWTAMPIHALGRFRVLHFPSSSKSVGGVGAEANATHDQLDLELRSADD
jgi:hypothetical protein